MRPPACNHPSCEARSLLMGVFPRLALCPRYSRAHGSQDAKKVSGLHHCLPVLQGVDGPGTDCG